MKKLFSVTILVAAALMLASCEHSDCLCKYYNENEQLIGYDSWDGTEVTASQCQTFENDNTVEVNGTDVVASSVSCSTSW